ncbi:hypothetical protein GII33_07360 [Gordonia pseudamarae]|jgi:hypothetical protein|uniref:Uncharacterized protein n=1 Tax=Gordonia pseudamarae TaxID=2831662 RepID=A0ABX6IFW0_9ACTN|nr:MULTISPECIES: hypothetical protein [Gordonia]MBD0020323.1 hypothetical protein [Gordonia sp. (in: high G+C Gram-positive bacteria)]QHN25810.1 hypothetical protein GII33_07360 [Gordonia pseudamarae]QHN34741.1 hypothetical protein GII31_07330 [Gordonia pseudamarae]
MAGDDTQPGRQYDFDTGDLLESSETWWKARGKTAETAANDLESLMRRVKPLFGENYWGDCVEGRATHTMFRRFIDTLVTDLTEQSASARNLSQACYEAARTIATADHNSAAGIASS